MAVSHNSVEQVLIDKRRQHKMPNIETT